MTVMAMTAADSTSIIAPIKYDKKGYFSNGESDEDLIPGKIHGISHNQTRYLSLFKPILKPLFQGIHW